MAVFNGELYVGFKSAQVSSNERDHMDGCHSDLEFGLSTQSMTVYNGHLYVGTYASGAAQVWSYDGTTWTNVSAAWTRSYAYSLAVYGGRLYAGTTNYSTGAQVWSYDGTTSANVSPSWDSNNSQADSMAAFGGSPMEELPTCGGSQVWSYNGTTCGHTPRAGAWGSSTCGA